MADEKVKDSNSSFEPTEKIEGFLIGLIIFIQHFLFTLRDLAFYQTRFTNAIKKQEADKLYTKPVTFITIISFLAIRIFRLGIVTVLLALGTVSCSRETMTETPYPSLLEELRVPSFTEIILYGIPTLIVVLLFSQLLKFLLIKGSDEANRNLVSITYYAVGFQYIAYLILFSILSLLLYLGELDPFSDSINYILLIFLLWVTLVFYRLVSKTIHRNDLRVSRPILKQIWLFTCAFLLVAITTTSGAGIAYSLAQFDVQDFESLPVLSMGLVGFDNSNEDVFTVNLLVRNNSTEEISLLSNQVTAYGRLQHNGEIINSSSGPAPVIILKPNVVSWLTVSFEKSGTDYVSGGFFSTRNIIEFTALNPSGEQETLSARIRSDGEIFEISEFE